MISLSVISTFLGFCCDVLFVKARILSERFYSIPGQRNSQPAA
jgi:hypothetical protein